MPNNYERLLISRFLVPGAGGRLALLIAAIGFAGVTIGVASLVLVVSFMNGAEARFASQIASADGQVFITQPGLHLLHPAQLEAVVAKIKGVGSATAELDATGLIGVNGRLFAADLEGLTPMSMATSPLFHRKATPLIGQAPTRVGTIALGSELATRLGIGIGDRAAISTIRNENGSPALINYSVTVSSIISTDVYDFDSRRVITSLNGLRSLLNAPYYATKVSVRLKSPDNEEPVVRSIRHVLGSGYTVTTWQSLNTALYVALAQEKLAMTIAVSLVTIIALSNILSSMVMLVRYKSREIAILRTMGMTKLSVAKVFVLVAAIIGVSGEAAGLGVGMGLKAAKDPVTDFLRTHITHPSIELDVMLSLPLAISSSEVARITILVFVGVVLSSLYPAIRAAAVDPATVLRHT